jgi:hypothetical protein
MRCRYYAGYSMPKRLTILNKRTILIKICLSFDNYLKRPVSTGGELYCLPV